MMNSAATAMFWGRCTFTAQSNAEKNDEQLQHGRETVYPSTPATTLAIAVIVFQLRVVTGTPKSRSRVPR
jgi:hypothetical protein